MKVLTSIEFCHCTINDCVLYCRCTIFFYYIEDKIYIGPYSEKIDTSIKKTRRPGVDIYDKGNIEYYTDVNIERLPEGIIKLL